MVREEPGMVRTKLQNCQRAKVILIPSPSSWVSSVDWVSRRTFSAFSWFINLFEWNFLWNVIMFLWTRVLTTRVHPQLIFVFLNAVISNMVALFLSAVWLLKVFYYKIEQKSRRQLSNLIKSLESSKSPKIREDSPISWWKINEGVQTLFSRILRR